MQQTLCPAAHSTVTINPMIINSDVESRMVTGANVCLLNPVSGRNVTEIIGVCHDITGTRKVLDEIEDTNRQLQETQSQLVQPVRMSSLNSMKQNSRSGFSSGTGKHPDAY